MLIELHIENLGVIEKLDLAIGHGLVALTGETGAGKTMLVEAIDLLVGGRADASVVRTGCEEARVEGRFVVDEDEVILCRVVPVSGRSRAYINGRLATVAQLAEHGAELVDLHGQHAHQSLLGASAQRMAIDNFCGVDLEPLRAARARVTEIEALLATLGGDERARAREIDLLRFQVNEILDAGLVGEQEDDDLSREEDLLADAVSHREALYLSVSQLQDDDGVSDSLGKSISLIGHRESFESLSVRLKDAQSEIDDIAREMRDLAETIEEDPIKLAQVRERRHLLVDLRRKYGESLSEVIAYGEESAVRLSELEGFEARAATLDADRASAVSQLRAAEKVVGSARRQAAPRLAKAVQQHLRSLAMAHAVVEVSVGNDPGDDVTFLLAANPGSPPAPLAKVASGGELARTMLALRLVLTQGPSTLVFDEVDAGIGGEAAVAVAGALAQLGERHQVLVVTHLAQVAAAAHRQIKVSKTVKSNQTFAEACELDAQDRIQEIARMLSGGMAEEAALNYASEILKVSNDRVGGKGWSSR
jgi:DNA repair protein RecN (Recombination protein N)